MQPKMAAIRPAKNDSADKLDINDFNPALNPGPFSINFALFDDYIPTPLKYIIQLLSLFVLAIMALILHQLF